MFDTDLGWVGHDDDLPELSDGGYIRRIDACSGDGSGTVERSVRYIRVPGTDLRRGLVTLADRPHRFSPGRMSRAQRERMVAAAASRGQTLRLTIVVEDEVDVGEIPARHRIGAAMEALGVPDHLSAMRRERIAKRAEVCAPTVEAMAARVAALGGQVRRTGTWPWCTLDVEVPNAALADILVWPEVLLVSWGAGPVSLDEGPCTATSRFDAYLDPKKCEDTTTGPEVYLDTNNLATGATAYIESHYDGRNITGLAHWARAADASFDPETGSAVSMGGEVGHLAIGVADSRLYSAHPAFVDVYGQTRVAAQLTSGLFGDIDVTRRPTEGDANWWAIVWPSSYNHGTSVAAIAAANITDGQDNRILTDEQREARSGVARGVQLVFAQGADIYGTSQLCALVDKMEAEDFVPDVLNASFNANSGANPGMATYWKNTFCPEHDPAATSTLCQAAAAFTPSFSDPCATLDEARGLNVESLRMTHLYYDGVIFTKSAGNMHTGTTANSTAWCSSGWPGVYSGTEVSSPGAAAGVLSVGAALDSHLTPLQVQATGSLNSQSSRGTTEDGRTYPMIVVPAFQCGCANYNPLAGSGEPALDYQRLGATSGAAPRMAGSVAIFKHWYLYHYPDLATSQARLMSNMLNLADGFAVNTSNARVDVPAAGWGLGRLKMRLFDHDHMSGTWHRSTESVRLKEGDWVSILLGKSDIGFLPRDTRRLRITVWWPEMNVGEGEDKPAIMACLQDDWILHDYRGSTNGDPIRFDFDCADTYFGRPPTGDLYLVLYGRRVPREVRGLMRDYRAVLVSWFWETGEDQATIQCGLHTAEVTCSL